MTKSTALGLMILNIAVPAAFVVAPRSAEASIISLVTHIFSAEAASNVESSSVNSQKMPLLEAPVNARLALASADIVVENDALVANVPLSGGMIPVNGDNDQITTYTVKEGDTVSRIAEKFGISANTILWANDLKRASTLSVGKKLVILPINGVQHKVVSGDTLLSIAKKYKADSEEIKQFNSLDSDILSVGDILIIPDGELQAQSAVSSKPSPKSAGSSAGASRAKAVAGYYIRPIKGGVRTQGIHGNNGVDLADSCGVPVYASAAGEVIISKGNGAWNGGYGNYVVIGHNNGSQTLYSHLSKALVSVGTRVAQGEQIGTEGATGKVQGVTGCHVHFEIRNGPANPF